MRATQAPRFFATRLATALLLVVGLLLLASAAYGRSSSPTATGAHDPIIFVHGYDGSGGQFESQKLRFVENGYPDNYVQVLEYDTTPATPVPHPLAR